MFLAGEEDQGQTGIPPTEDLMREHGVLIRILLIYGAAKKYLIAETLCDLSFINHVILETALIAEHFIEDYHQKLEEQYVFPAFLQEQKLVQLVHTLRDQHQAARELTRCIKYFAAIQNQPMDLADLLSSYIRMYEPHSAREDTVIFPAFRQLVSPSRLEQLGQKFEEIEEKLFGKNGFQRIVTQVSQIEQALGIYTLSQFTPSYT